jgi:hypothetical protein
MTNDDLEKILLNVPRSHIVADSHRSDLKRQLLQTPQYRRRTMIAKKWKMTIAICVSLLILAAVGKGAQQVFSKFFVVEKTVSEPTVLPDGSVHTTSRTVITTGETQEQANQQWIATKTAIAQGHYKLINVDNTDPRNPVYCYSVTLEDGSTVGYGVGEPLPDNTQ